MTADRPVSAAPDTVTDDMVAAYRRVAIGCSVSHGSAPYRDACCDRAGLEAVVSLIRAQVAAELVAEAARAANDQPAEFTAAYLGEWLARQPITLGKPTTVAAPSTVILAEDFHEPDEPVADVQAAFDAADKGVTRRPASMLRRVDFDTAEEQAEAEQSANEPFVAAGPEEHILGDLLPVGSVAVDPADLRTVLDARCWHSHSRPGVWDDDNPPERAGKPCVECAARERLRAALEATDPNHTPKEPTDG